MMGRIRKTAPRRGAINIHSSSPSNAHSLSERGEEYIARVQQKAYELYLKSGRAYDDPLADWYQAEKMVSPDQ